MTFLELAEQVLKDEMRPLTATQIWTIAESKGYDKQLNSEGKTPWSTLGAQIYVNAKDKSKTLFAQTETRPKKFYLKSHANQINLVDIEEETESEEFVVPTATKKKKFEYLEKHLHSYLTYFAFYHLRCYTKTINHSHSPKKEFGEWVHPDIVGCYFPFDEWKTEVYDLSSSISNTTVKLFSFELKRELSFANLRESFFQTVSNSSWANESYLVTANLSKEQEFRDELSRLSTSFGIGVIQLNIDDPNSSEIIFPAKSRKNLDWETINKLTMTSDFTEFISTVKIDISSKKIHKKEYDPILDAEKMIIPNK